MGEVVALPARGFNPEVQLPLAAGAEHLRYATYSLYDEELFSADVIPFLGLQESSPALPQFSKILEATHVEVSSENPQLTSAIKLSELIMETEIQRKAAEFIGSVLLTEAVITKVDTHERVYALSDAIGEASTGNREARTMVEQNVASDFVERTFKSGHITKVDLQVTADNTIIQHGQTDTEIQANSLRYGSNNLTMRERTKAESRNMFRRQEAYRQGYLEECVEVVFSLVDTELPEKELAKQGFFTDTMSCAIQATTLEDESLTLESAFVAGKKTRESQRHDVETIYKLGEFLGVDFRGMSATEILDTPILVPKHLMPNGVIDLVKLYDECADGTFFGEAKPRQDYLVFKKQCADREKEFKPRVKAITEKLLAEAETLQDPTAACKRLNKLSAEEMIEQSVVDASINPMVFGAEAAFRIEHARYLAANGQLQMMHTVMHQAKTLERSSSCPGGVGGGDRGEGVLTPGRLESAVDDNKSETLEDCEFISLKCPICKEENVKTVVKKGKYYGECGCVA